MRNLFRALIMETPRITHFMPYSIKSRQQNPLEKKIQIVTLAS